MINRRIYEELRALLKGFYIVSVTGPRQSGKTTLLKQCLPEYEYVTLENLDSREFARQDPKQFLERYDHKVIIDEAQEVPELFSYLQGIVDDKKQPGQYILSGSQNFLLSEHISQSLAGRVGVLKLLPLSYRELTDAGFDSDIFRLLHTGLYPALYDREVTPYAWYKSYVETYLERDVRQMKNIGDLGAFKKLLIACAHRSGQLVNYNALSDACGVSHTTVRDWLGILEANYVIYMLQPFTAHAAQRSIKSPKLYFYDTGLLCQLLEIESGLDLQDQAEKGAVFETFIVSEYLKSYYNSNRDPKLYFWRDRNGHEVDLVIDHPKKSRIIEIKASTTLRMDDAKQLHYYEESIYKKEIEKAVIYMGDESTKRYGVDVLSWKDIVS